MRTTPILITMLLALATASPVLAETDYTDREQYNPQHDPDIDRGYKESQDCNREREDRDERKERGEIERPYDVDISGQDSAGGKHGK
jgi:hypothetical protein